MRRPTQPCHFRHALSRRDFPLIQATVLVTVVLALLVQLLVDLLYPLIDPRVRLGQEAR